MPQDILEPIDKQIIERELNLQNRLYPRPSPLENPESGNQPPVKRSRRHRPHRRQRKRARLNYHRAKCAVCNHPECDAIQEAFLQWASPQELVKEFRLSNRAAIYRHAHAFGLFEKRAAQTRHALGLIIEQASDCEASADAIIKAVRALSCLDENGHWHEPTRRLIVTHERVEGPAPPSHPGPQSIATQCEQKTA